MDEKTHLQGRFFRPFVKIDHNKNIQNNQTIFIKGRTYFPDKRWTQSLMTETYNTIYYIFIFTEQNDLCWLIVESVKWLKVAKSSSYLHDKSGKICLPMVSVFTLILVNTLDNFIGIFGQGKPNWSSTLFCIRSVLVRS